MADRYRTDLAYPGFFHRETAPLWLAAAATALGRRAPDPAQPFTWMELGCGAGLNAALLAAANPHGQFIGIDLNPAHVAQAQARAAGLANLRFLCADLLHLARAADAPPVPDCDFIVVHGVYSWVSEAVRQAIRSLAQRRLRPGGLLYLAYMSHPGPSAFAAARHTMRLHAQLCGGPAEAQAQAALQFLRGLADAGAGYFAAHPGMAAALEHMAHEPPGYLAHEFLNPHWQPLHVAEVMADCAQAGLHYVGSATLLENIDAVSVPERTQPLLRGIADPALAETVRDLARNQSQRRDLYQRGGDGPHAHALPAPEHRARLLAQVIAPLPGMPARGPFTLSGCIGPVQASDAHFTPLLQALQRGPQRLAGLARLPAYAQQPGFLNQASQMLYGAGCAHPAVAAAEVVVEPAWQLNRRLAAQADGPCWLAAPALGTALPSAPLQRLAAQALLADPALQGEALARAVAPGSAPERPLREALAAFERAVLPLWRRYGVVP